MRLAQAKGVDPTHQVTAWRRNPRGLAAGGIDIVVGHRGQRCAALLTGTLVAKLQLIEDAAMLWIEKDERRTASRERMQQRE